MTIEINGIAIAPGEEVFIDLPLPPLYTHEALSMPVHVINGKRDGPRLFVSAAMHGDEINGVDIIRRLLKHEELNANDIRGTLIAIPVVNVYGFITKSRYLPDRRDLNRSFPGSSAGSMASRLAHLFVTEIATQCTHGIDLHTAAEGRENLPQIRAALTNNEIKKMACAFGAPVVKHNASFLEGSMRETADKLGIPVLLYEAGEALRFNELSIRAGVEGVINVMRAINMLPDHETCLLSKQPRLTHSSKWERATHSGILRTITPLGERVREGDLLGIISDPFGEKEEHILSSTEGIVIGKSTLPLVYEGEALYHIAHFDAPQSIAQSVEDFQQQHDPELYEIPDEPPVK
ncbi:MAG: FIG003737: Predicted deacylase [uncultured Thiotrichaceae bacterium]|uniref:FIG003737: Predicted deacylase n=1 Tax=uncultured Thiotrichaceae bacterium TaxID=298394 RepID=A0A6S6UHN9_9GAMM|nr:MAG: FIG003737: Predicted deacylase [uncultured Thiotrichaceae bacterium]